MQKDFTILVSDRNRYVREFLKRELTAQGYRVKLARTGREVLKEVFNHEALDLLILDLDLPEVKELSIMEKLGDRIPAIPVVIHCFLEEYVNHQGRLSTTAFVEKEGTNIDRLKAVVLELLRKTYPMRFESRRRLTGSAVERSGGKDS